MYLLTSRPPGSHCLLGINSIGLRRRDFSNDQIKDIQEIYRYLYQSGLNNSDAIERMRLSYLPQGA